MMKLILLLLGFFIIQESYSQSKFLTIEYADTTLSYPIIYKHTDSLVSNRLEAYFAADTNVLAFEKNYYYGKQNGIYKAYYPSGATYIFCVYQQGKIHGDWAKYDEFGKILQKAKYVNGVKHGFFSNKAERYQGRYKNGERHGKWEFNLNSLNYYKRYYDNGELVGKRKVNIIPNLSKDKEGLSIEEPEVVQVWEEKQLDTIQIDYPDRSVKYSVRYINRDSIEHPTMRKAVFRDSTQNTAIIKYIYGGKLSGNYKIYFPNGKLYKHLFYTYGNLNGDYKEYTESGELIIVGKYKNGKKHGKWKYNIALKEYYTEVYKNGKLIKSSKSK